MLTSVTVSTGRLASLFTHEGNNAFDDEFRYCRHQLVGVIGSQDVREERQMTFLCPNICGMIMLDLSSLFRSLNNGFNRCVNPHLTRVTIQVCLPA